MTMKKGEVALLTIAPEYAFGSSESKQDLAVIPPNSTVHYEVELVSFVKVCDVFFLFIFQLLAIWQCVWIYMYIIFSHWCLQDKESWDMNTPEKIEAAGKKKEEGNALFKACKYTRASKRYEKVDIQLLQQFGARLLGLYSLKQREAMSAWFA